MEKREKKGKRTWLNLWTILLMTTMVLCGVCVWRFPAVMAGSCRFTDFLVGEAAYSGTNKTGEWRLFWLLLVLGCALVGILGVLQRRVCLPESGGACRGEKMGRREAMLCGLCCFLPAGMHLLLYGKTTALMLCFSVMAAGVVMIYRAHAFSMAALFLCLYFFVESFSVIAAVFFHHYFLGDRKVLLLAALLFAVTAYGMHRQDEGGKERIYQTALSLSQLPIPFLFLVYAKTAYAYRGTVVHVGFPLCYVLLLTCLTAALFVWQVCLASTVLLKRDSKRAQGRLAAYLQKNAGTVGFPTVFAVFSFVSYLPPAQLLQADLHHHGEQLLPWHQIVELGQRAYAEYSPASGFFPMLIGLVNDVVFHGQANEYGMSYLFFMLLFEALTMWLLCRRIGGERTLVVAVLFHMPVYCRTWILLPVLLLLSERRLTANNGRWLLAWVFSCFLAGLYYPLFGGALLIATLPFGLVRTAVFFRKKEWKKLGAGEICFGVALLLLIGAACPLLFRMLSHVRSMAGQTLGVDGMAVIGYETPSWFLPYLAGWRYRTLVYYVLRFVLGILFVLLFFYLLIRYVKENRGENKWHEPGFLMFSAIPVVLCVCYSYTMVCMDEAWVGRLLSRSAHVIFFVAGLFGLTAVWEYGERLLIRGSARLLTAFLFCVPFLFFYQCRDYGFPFFEGAADGDSYVVGEYAAKLAPYAVADNYMMLTDKVRAQYPYVAFERIGQGFAREETLEHLNRYAFVYAYLRQFDREVNMLGFEQSQLQYYLLNEKAVYSGRTAIAKSRSATKKVIAALDGHTVVRPGVSSLEQYYLYRHLVRAGYVYSAELELYLPGALYRRIYGRNGTLYDSPWAKAPDCAMAANAFGKSLSTLENCEKTFDVDSWSTETGEDGAFLLTIPEPHFAAKERPDFLYLTLEHAEGGKAVVSWDCADSGKKGEVWCDCGDGRLLVPVGANALWLTGTPTQLTVRIENIPDPARIKVREVSYYSLK